MSGDLKAVFGRTKEDNAEEEQKANWDQDEEEEEETKDEQPTLLSSLLSVDPSAEKEESSGFKFSFFGDDTETENKETGELYLRYLRRSTGSFPNFYISLSLDGPLSARRVQGREHPSAKGVMATRPTFP